MASSSADQEPVQIVYADDAREHEETEDHSHSEDKAGLTDHEQESASASRKPAENGSASTYEMPGNIDVNDPSQIIELLENVDLTEEDTEILLQDAYKMNRKLKEILRRQDEAEKTKKGGEGKGKKSKQQSKSMSNSSSISGSRTGSAFSSQKAPLPPITIGSNPQTSDIYNMKMKRSSTNISVVKKPAEVPQRSKSTRNSSQRQEESPKQRKSKLRGSESKPEWNERFNFT